MLTNETLFRSQYAYKHGLITPALTIFHGVIYNANAKARQKQSQMCVRTRARIKHMHATINIFMHEAMNQPKPRTHDIYEACMKAIEARRLTASN